MKKHRRIEVTAFRRRTTIILRDRPDVGPAGRPTGDGEPPLPAWTDEAWAEEICLDRTHINLTVRTIRFQTDARLFPHSPSLPRVRACASRRG
jgi:hypothetical protein